MFCKKCGKEIKEGSKFCPACGTPVGITNNNVESQMVQENVEQVNQNDQVQQQYIQENKNVNVQQQNYQNAQTATVNAAPKKPLTKKQKTIIGSIAGGVVLIAIIVAVIVLSPKGINPFDGTYLNATGYNGYGRVYIDQMEDVDSELKHIYDEIEKMEDEYENVCNLSTVASEKCVKLLEDAYHYGQAFRSIEEIYDYGEGKENGLLSNGDVVTVTLDYDEEAFKKIGYKLSKTSMQYTVEGLEELKEIDILSYVDASWTSSWGDFYLEKKINDDCPVSDYIFEVSEVNESGDVTITVDDIELAKEYGIKAKDGVNTKTVHVGKQPQRVDSVNDENHDKVAQLAMDVLNSVYCDKCGWNLYNGDNIELITEKTVTDLWANYGTVHATFDVTTDAGKTYMKTITFSAYVDSNGEYKTSTEFDKDDIGCTIRYGKWYEY